MLKMELHKEIAAWLDKFKLIQANSKALMPNAEIEDLVAIIRDGVVPINLFNRSNRSGSSDIYVNQILPV